MKTIAIIAGGDSSEHDVSLKSAAGIDSWLDRTRYIVYTIEVKGLTWTAHLHDGTTTEVNRHDFTFVENGKTVKPDFAYITIHGTPGENGIMQGYFDLLHIPYSTCSLLVAALTFDKFTLNQYLKGFGVKIAESLLLRKGQSISNEEVVERIGLPCFIKPNASGSSFGVTHCKTTEDIQKAIGFAQSEGGDVMIEAELKGTEIANGVYRKRNGEVYVLPITEVVSQNDYFDFDAKYNGQVTEITPARLPDETTERVDVINLLEINATPGMTATSFIPQQARADHQEMADILTEVIEGRIDRG